MGSGGLRRRRAARNASGNPRCDRDLGATLFYQSNHPRVYAVKRKPGTDVFRPHSADHPGDESIPGLLIIRTEGRMTFASVPRAREPLAALVDAAHPKVVILECSAIPDIEYTALQILTSAEEKLREGGSYCG